MRANSVRVLRRMFAFCILLALPAFVLSESIDSLRQRAENGDSEAEFKLAQAYYRGAGIRRDPKQGLRWLLKSATQGNVSAEFELGFLYEVGEQSVFKSPREAARWFRKAASHSQAARVHLAKMRAEGLISKQEADWQTPLSGDETPKALESKTIKETAFSFGEIEEGLSGGITCKRMATLVDTYGVSFKLTPELSKRLAAEGADDQLLAVISGASP